MRRRQNFQTISWFWDLYERNRLNLDPPYQRRSVWNSRYRTEFIETILLVYPAPAIFLYEEIEPSGIARYNVVDGKQRLTTIFDFVQSRFPITDDSSVGWARGKYFEQLDRERKTEFWGYQFSVEYLPVVEDTVLTDVFNRINKNVAKLTPQELRHARYTGAFNTSCEAMSAFMETSLGTFPRIIDQSRRQMKDVELTSQLLLTVESGRPRGYSQDELDAAFAERDEAWDKQQEVEESFRTAVGFLRDVLSLRGEEIRGSRLRNQTDFYSLFSAVVQLVSAEKLPSASNAAAALVKFATDVDDENVRESSEDLRRYYDATRSAANDTGAREKRTEVFAAVLEKA